MARNYKRDRKGRFAKVGSLRSKVAGSKIGKNAAVVPYARVGVRSQSAGVNAGANITPKFRVSAGAYVRVERRQQTGLEKKIKSADKAAINKITKAISPTRSVDPYIEKALQKSRRKIVNKTIGGQKKIGTGASARLTTSQGGLPSLTVRRGMSKVPTARRRKAIDDYNAAMQRSLKGNKTKKPRPQRRVAAARRAA